MGIQEFRNIVRVLVRMSREVAHIAREVVYIAREVVHIAREVVQEYHQGHGQHRALDAVLENCAHREVLQEVYFG